MNTRARSICVATLTAGLLLMAAPAQAAPAIDARCGAVLDPLTDRFLFAKAATKPCYTGSTAKMATLGAALELRRSGKILSGDLLGITPQGLRQPCTCLGSYAVNQSPADTNDFGQDPSEFEALSYHRPGETLGSLDDVLFGVAMSAAQPTVAIAEHSAARFFGKPAATTVAESNALEALHVRVMRKYAKQAKPGGSVNGFVNEHGGDGAVPGVTGKSKVSPKVMTRVWAHYARRHPDFTRYLGVRLHQFSTTYPSPAGPVARQYRFAKGYAYYPGVVADKNGGSTGCRQCLITQVRRLGRSLIADVQESTRNEADAAAILRHGFGRVFQPRRRDHDDDAKATRDTAVACFLSSCLVTAPDGAHDPRVTLWRVGADGLLRRTSAAKPTGSIKQVKEVAVAGGAGVFFTAQVVMDSTIRLQQWSHGAGGLRQQATSVAGNQATLLDLGKGTGVELALAPAFGAGALAVASRTSQGVRVQIVHSDRAGKPFRLGPMWTVALPGGGPVLALALQRTASGVMVAAGGLGVSQVRLVHLVPVDGGGITQAGALNVFPKTGDLLPTSIDVVRHPLGGGTTRDGTTHSVVVSGRAGYEIHAARVGDGPIEGRGSTGLLAGAGGGAAAPLGTDGVLVAGRAAQRLRVMANEYVAEHDGQSATDADYRLATLRGGGVSELDVAAAGLLLNGRPTASVASGIVDGRLRVFSFRTG